MQYTIKTGTPEKQASACVIVPVFDNNKLSTCGQTLNRASEAQLSEVLKSGDLKPKPGNTLLLHSVKNIKAKRIILVHFGKKKELNENTFCKSIRGALSVLKNTGATNAILYLDDIWPQSRDLAWASTQTVLINSNLSYRFTELKSKDDKDPSPLKTLSLGFTDHASSQNAEKSIKDATAIGKGQAITRTLGNLPGNICTPAYLADKAKKLAKEYSSISTQILDESEMKELGMGALLSVSAGSKQPAKLIIMQHKGGKKDQHPQVLIGKGVTFDSGGISLKPGAAMDEMKFDMCGAASVFGTLAAVAELGLKINLVVIVAAAENMPGGGATKPGDIVTSMSGQTIEILNTDAEGRLVLCDALSYAERFNPAAIIDVATLTGACVIALGEHASGLMTNQDSLAQELISAGEHMNDRAWQLPLWEDYQHSLDSNFADMANVGGRAGGTITAACFLSKFTKKQRWAHLDIAGTAWLSGKKKGASGRPVALLTRYLQDREEALQIQEPG